MGRRTSKRFLKCAQEISYETCYYGLNSKLSLIFAMYAPFTTRVWAKVEMILHKSITTRKKRTNNNRQNVSLTNFG